MKEFRLLFNELHHKYMDTYGTIYTSMTTCIAKYEPVFPRVKVAAGCSRKPTSKYFGWAVKDILKDWDDITDVSLVRGNKTHNYLEDVTKKSTNYNFNVNSPERDYVVLYTVDDIVNGTAYGELDPDKYLKTGIKQKYPRIYNLFVALSQSGYKFYSEIGVYDTDWAISGLIDILAVNHDTKEFIIIDWKTNKHDLIPYGKDENKWKAGYFEKDNFGHETGNYIYKEKFFKSPLHKYQASNYVKYLLQLNGYALLFANKGFKLKQIILCHVRDDLQFTETHPVIQTKPEYLHMPLTEFHNMEFIPNDLSTMFTHHANGMTNDGRIKFN